MSNAIRQESPLVERVTAGREELSPGDAGVRLHEHRFLGYINLRGRPEDTGFRSAAEGVLGLELPVEPNTFVEDDRLAVYWLCPSEWMVVTEPGREPTLVEALESALAGQSFAVNDVTGYYITIVIEGPHARDTLEKGCTLDLHPRAFGAGQCAQTLLSHAGILVRPAANAQGFEIVVRRSFADYVFVYLDDAAADYGMAVAE